MDLKNIQSVYFIGIGGIGMSALARYFLFLGKKVAGYDRTETDLTRTLSAEGMEIHYRDEVSLIPAYCKAGPEKVMVIFTPAIPKNHSEWNWFQTEGYTLIKRAQALGEISRQKKTIAIAGTHGKTSITTMTSYLLKETGVGCDAFLGGISKNYQTNLLLQEGSEWVVIEADEFDRSFHWLRPYIAVISAMDADHLDIYGDHEAVKVSFSEFTAGISDEGILLTKLGVEPEVRTRARRYRYSLRDTNADFYAENIRLSDGKYCIDLHTPFGVVPSIKIGVPGLLNVENAVAAMAAAILSGADKSLIPGVMPGFSGVNRRFDIRFRSADRLYIDDYGHHPEELRFTLQSIRDLYPGRHITAVFQPHLYSRTRDFAEEFAKSLSLADALFLLDIYPAREEPIEGVTSSIIFDRVNLQDKILCRKEDFPDLLEKHKIDILVTMGAGDIDRLIIPITDWLKKNS
ncbi:MAG: UDP-N-acetylmuramate--L-alanine ligase [Bacteroidales bacterium]|nr:UDP-N-acetylmuramate--L-alanine ligase [Bacteroidales bacterium]